MLGLSTSLRAPTPAGVADAARLGADAGFTALAFGDGLPLSIWEAAARAAAHAGLPVIAAVAPVPDAPLAPDKRVAHLAATDDPDERLSAVALVARALERARDLGIRSVVLDLGPARLATSERRFRHLFACREADAGEVGAKVFADALAERRARADRLLDAARDALERVVREAERVSVTLLLPFAGHPWGVPSPREALLLVKELAGAPLGLAFSTAAWATLARLGLEGPPERERDLLAATRLMIAADAVGIDAPFAPGLGEHPYGAPKPPPREIPGETPVVVSGQTDTTAREIAAARSLVTPAATTTSS